jgi:hypothetical protein
MNRAVSSRMAVLRASMAFITGLAIVFASCAFADNKEKQRTEVRKTAQQTLDRLYKVQPAARASIASAAGYAVFSNFGMKILVAGGAREAALRSTTSPSRKRS